jgi:osmotically-inducible protein OsmY
MQGITIVDDHMSVRSHPPSAARLAQAVQSRLKNDTATSTRRIQVQARRDVISLRGTVPDLYTKQKAIHLARSVPFVSVVEDHLTIPPGLSDHALAEQVRQALERSPLAVQRPLRVVATGSHISVRGGAYTWAARLRVGVIASRVPGVTGLNNMVVVLPRAVRRQWSRNQPARAHEQ